MTDDMKTHKNPALREKPGAKPAPSAKPSVSAKPQPQKPAANPPKCALEGKKWVVVSVTEHVHYVSKKVPTFKLSVTLSNLN